MSSEFGEKLRVSVFGQSHGDAIGAVVNGLPSGEKICESELLAFIERRKGGKNAFSTARKESDIPKFLSGLENFTTTGAPLSIVIENEDRRSSDYTEILDKPRPSHADFTAFVKWKGKADMRGGGHFSGRLTLPLVVAGGIAKQILERRGIFVGAHLKSVGEASDISFSPDADEKVFRSVAEKEFPVLSDEAGEMMKNIILSAKAEGDSVGGVVECMAIGIPAGVGEPMFDGVENNLAKALFGIPAVKGVEFGAGFESAKMRGSEHNDPFEIKDGKITTVTNNAGGILGGITTGAPIVLRVAIKPTPSIAKEQNTVSLSKMENAKLSIKGRHDPCIAARAVPVVEAVTALVILDMIM